MIQELLEKRDHLFEIAAVLYGDMFIAEPDFWDSPTESVTCLFSSSIATSSPACTKNVLDRATWDERFVIAGEKPRNGSVTSR